MTFNNISMYYIYNQILNYDGEPLLTIYRIMGYKIFQYIVLMRKV